jgi:hypothetical protein
VNDFGSRYGAFFGVLGKILKKMQRGLRREQGSIRTFARLATCVAVIITAALASACDQGRQHDQTTGEGPPVNLTGATVGANTKLPANGAVQLQFDRLLLPITITRQTILLVDAANNALAPVIAYDPVARVVTLSRQEGQDWLKADQQYYVIVRTPTGPDDNGVRAIDGAPLAPVDKIGFLTAAEGPQPFGEPAPSFCNDVLPIFQRSCTAPICHGAPTQTTDKTRFGDQGLSAPAAGLILETSDGIAHTAIGRVANGANTGARSASSEPGRVFGVDAPVIEPNNPGNSWMMYKLLLARPGAKNPTAQRAKCDATAGTPPMPDLVLAPPLTADTPNDGDRAILGDFVLGREMPYPDMGPDGPHDTKPGLNYGELERIRLWIAKGAQILQDCGACEP